MESNATPSVPRRRDAGGDNDETVAHDAAAGPARHDDRAAAAPERRSDRVSDPAVGTTASAPTTTGEAGTSGTTEPTRVALDPALDAHHRQGFTGSTWIALILGTVILILLLIFILQNNVPTDFAYFGWQFSLPLGIAMLFAAIAGVLITALLGSVRLFKQGRRIRRLEKERAEIKRALG